MFAKVRGALEGAENKGGGGKNKGGGSFSPPPPPPPSPIIPTLMTLSINREAFQIVYFKHNQTVLFSSDTVKFCNLYNH